MLINIVILKEDKNWIRLFIMYSDIMVIIFIFKR